MKVLSMIQPWATLLVLRETRNETRTWRTHYRGPVAIHASQKIDKTACREEPVHSILFKHGYSEDNLPTGVIMAACRIVNCLQVMDRNEEFTVLDNGDTVSGVDHLIGGYGVGHYVWVVEDMRLLPEFIPAKGKLGLWEFSGDLSTPNI